MTREEAKNWIELLIETMKKETSGNYPDPKYCDEVYKALDMAINALEQEPILDKVRADVINIADSKRSIPVRSVIKIIDKHKAQISEGKE